MNRRLLLSLLAAMPLGTCLAADDFLTYEPKGEAKGKHIVLISGDEEYRSEEAMPMLARILSERHGFKTTVLFSVDKDGFIDSNNQESVTNPAALDSADAILMSIRFRHWPDAAMKHFHDAVQRGVPIIGLRTSTHAFNMAKDSTYGAWAWNNEKGGFGRIFLGETWVSHWGKHRSEATKGILESTAKDNALLRGVTDLFGTTDVYEAAPPADAVILARGQVLAGMEPGSPPADYRKKNKAGTEQSVNDPMMPIAWSREVKNESGKTNKVLCTTMGAATDLTNESLRRLVVNGVYWGLGLEVPASADVTYVGDFKPLMYGTKDGTDLNDPHRFRGFKRGVKPADLK
jgi:predicted dinucleotide-binding enzyme